MTESLIHEKKHNANSILAINDLNDEESVEFNIRFVQCLPFGRAGAKVVNLERSKRSVFLSVSTSTRQKTC